MNLATYLPLQPTLRMCGVYVHTSTRLDAAILYKVMRQLHRYLHFLRISQRIVYARHLRKRVVKYTAGKIVLPYVSRQYATSEIDTVP